MTTSKLWRLAALGMAGALGSAVIGAAPAVAAKPKTGAAPKPHVSLQILSFNDFHGHLEATDKPLPSRQDPSQTNVGGAEYLASTLTALRAGKKNTLTVAAGDLIGGSPYLSGSFHDEPAIESLNAMGLDVAGVGNHEFDEGTAELLRIANGGCHPDDGCYFPDDPYDGTDFDYLAANVLVKKTGKTLLPATEIKVVEGVKVGFIGMTLEATNTLVNPAGVSAVEFRDEVETANKQAVVLKKQGVEAIVVLLHEGGYQEGTYNQCKGISDPVAQIAANMHPEIDLIVTGHTHQPYVCQIPDPKGDLRLVTSAADYGRVVTETTMVLNRNTGDMIRGLTRAKNHLVDRAAVTPDPTQSKIIAKWQVLAGQQGNEVVGTHTEDILGDSSGNRGIETPMADLVADAILWGNPGSQIAFMNVGGVREDLPLAPKYPNDGEQSGQILQKEAFDIAPFSNLLTTIDLTGAQIKAVLEQQYVKARSRQYLALGVSEGFTYEWDDSRSEGDKVLADTMMLNGKEILPGETYRVATLNFLADGGDSFMAFTGGTNRIDSGSDLANLVDYFKAHPALTAPDDRVKGL